MSSREAIDRAACAKDLAPLASSSRVAPLIFAASGSLAMVVGLLVYSMSRKGNCWDNAPVENFFNSLKNERNHGSRYATRVEARQDISEYIACSTIGAFATPRSVMSARHSTTPPGRASRNWRLEGHRLASEKHGQAQSQ